MGCGTWNTRRRGNWIGDYIAGVHTTLTREQSRALITHKNTQTHHGDHAGCDDCAILLPLRRKQAILYADSVTNGLPYILANKSPQASPPPSDPSLSLPPPHNRRAPSLRPPEPSTGWHPKPVNRANRAKADLACPLAAVCAAQP
jgi:hypothetical protein